MSTLSPVKTLQKPHHQTSLPADETRAVPTEQTAAAPMPWYAWPFVLTVLGGILLWAAFPPLSFWPLAWLAPVPWLLLVRAEKLAGKRPYLAIYAGSFLHWFLLIQWVRKGHWAANFGWVALALYLAIYLPLFIGLARVAVKRFRMPLALAAPIVWVGIECARGWVLTGFSIAALGHTQIHWLPVIQISDLAGSYGVSFLIVLVASAVAQCLPLRWLGLGEEIGQVASRRPAYFSLSAALILLGAALIYGQYRLGQIPPGSSAAPARIALIQGSIDTVFGDPTLDDKTIEQYAALSREALDLKPDALVWPESTFPYTHMEYERLEGIQSPPWFGESPPPPEVWVPKFDGMFRDAAAQVGYSSVHGRVPVILGTSTLGLGPHRPKRFNSAVLIDADGRIADKYHKMHPVMFGEYVPLGTWFPALYNLMPIPEGLTPGPAPKTFNVAGLKLMPSVCYENTVPHLIRGQLAELRANGDEPDALVTLSNDGWFWGSSELDMHLICGQFRAVELRKPAIIAANTGFSAHVDGNGRLLKKGPRRQTEKVIAELRPDGRDSLYAHMGDMPANLALVFCLGLAVAGIYFSRRPGVQ